MTDTWVQRLLGLAVAITAAGAMATAAQAAPDFSGTWWIKDRSEAIPATEAVAPPLKPSAAAQYRRNQEALARGETLPVGEPRCLPLGMPRIMLARYPIQILHRPEQMTILHERQGKVRMIYMDAEYDAESDPTYFGFSSGRWENDVLVVETQGLVPHTVIDNAGLPHSDRMKITERFSLTADGETLRDHVTIDDPESYGRPWSFTLEFAKQRDVRLMDDVCNFGGPARDRAARP